MIDIDIRRLTPRYLMQDKNGKALAMAIKASMDYASRAADTGLGLIGRVEDMPEWRLDELAWEYNCLYDHKADISEKRRWIKDSVPLYRVYGTPRAVINYLIGSFESVEVEESSLYGGDPFHFRVTVSGEWTNAKEEWARRAIEGAKNVRSVLDDISVGKNCHIAIRGSGREIARFPYEMTGEGLMVGTLPQANMAAGLDEGRISAAGEAYSSVFAYPMTGTAPDINMPAGVSQMRAETGAEGWGNVYPFIMCGTSVCEE